MSVTIFRSTDLDGATYALAPESRAAIQKAFPGVHLAPRMFVAHETREDFELVHGSMRGQIIQILAGVSEERLHSALGPVRFCDPVTDREISASPAHP
jgi:hypothetical protein